MSQDQSVSSAEGQRSENEKPPKSQQRGLRRWTDLAGEILAQAQAEGAFDNLPGKGKPLRLDDDTYAGDKALAYRMLKNGQAAPPEIERGREIDDELTSAEDLLVALRRRRDALLRAGATTENHRAYVLVRETTEARYREFLRAINSKVLSLNIIAPPALHRPLIKVEAKMQAFAEEFLPELA